MKKPTFSHLFRQATALVMTALTAASARLLGELLTLTPGSVPPSSVPGRLEAIAGGVVLYLTAAVVTAEVRLARDKR